MPTARAKPRDIEGPIQAAIVRYLRTTLPAGWLVVGVANKPRSLQQGAKEKRQGAVSGYPDVTILGQRDGMPWAWFIEVKAPKGAVSDEQKDVHDRLTEIGFRVAVAKSIDDVRALVWRWDLPTSDLAARPPEYREVA